MSENELANCDYFHIGDDLEITRTTRLVSGEGALVNGTIHGHQFAAMVFGDHANHSEWEIDNSRIVQLWIERLVDHQVMYCWERGLITDAGDRIATAIVEFLCDGLADYVFRDIAPAPSDENQPPSDQSN